MNIVYEDALAGVEKHDSKLDEIKRKFLPLIQASVEMRDDETEEESYEKTNQWWIDNFGMDDNVRAFLADLMYNSPNDPKNIILAAMKFGSELPRLKMENLL